MIQVAICDENNKTLEKLEKLIKNTLGNEVSVSTHDNVFSLVTYVCDERKGKLDAVYIDFEVALDQFEIFILILMRGRKEVSLQRKACKKNIPILK